MWYTNSEKKELDYSKPICAVNKGSGSEYLLLPSMCDNSYKLRGFDWFNVKTGKFNSCMNWESVRDAVHAYIDTHVISNCAINLHKTEGILNAKN